MFANFSHSYQGFFQLFTGILRCIFPILQHLDNHHKNVAVLTILQLRQRLAFIITAMIGCQEEKGFPSSVPVLRALKMPLPKKTVIVFCSLILSKWRCCMSPRKPFPESFYGSSERHVGFMLFVLA
jgi:hypothetical protein